MTRRSCPLLTHPPLAAVPPAPGHPLPTPLPPGQFPDPARLPPWLQNPSPPGFAVSPPQPPPLFGWDRPDGHSWLPEIGHDLGEAGKAVSGWVVFGGVLVWTTLSEGGQGGEAAVP